MYVRFPALNFKHGKVKGKIRKTLIKNDKNGFSENTYQCLQKIVIGTQLFSTYTDSKLEREGKVKYVRTNYLIIASLLARNSLASKKWSSQI